MGKGDQLGEFEELVLLAVAALTGEAYGFAVQQLLAEDADRKTALATVHAALYRLERKGYLRSTLGGATQQRGGRSKRLFAVTNAGRAALEAKQAARAALWNRIAWQPGT